MSTYQQNITSVTHSTYSSKTRRDVLWNVVEPGDPYDIRKSMIAKLPGDHHEFMGNNLEIVCLFQSAEIERLCQFLDDFKYRYRELERRELDRHSYEIQIKQLTQKLSDQAGFKGQNSKLKEFIKKLTVQIEELKGNKYNADSGLRINYEKALQQIEIMTQEINHYKAENNTLLMDVNSHLAKIQAFQSIKQIEQKELFLKYSSENKHVFESQINSLKARHQTEIHSFQFEIKRLKEFNDAKNQQINEMNQKNRNLLIEIDELQQKSKNSTMNSQLVEQRYMLFGKQIQRLNLILKETTFKFDQASQNQLLWQQKYNRIEGDYRSLQQTKRDLQDKIFNIKQDYERKSLAMSHQETVRFTEQIDRLTIELRRHEDEKRQQRDKFYNLQKQYSDLEYQLSKITIIQRQNNQLRQTVQANKNLKYKVAEYEGKIAMLSQQIQRLSDVTSNYEIKLREFTDIKYDFENYKRKSIEKQRSLIHEHESQLQKRIMQYQNKILQYSQQSGYQFENRIQVVNQELERVKAYLKDKHEEAEGYQRKIRELENSIYNKYQVETNRKISTYESTITQLRSYTEDINRRYRQLENTNRKIPEYQNRIAMMSQEMQRLNNMIRTKTQDAQNFQRQIRQLEVRFTNASSQQEIETSRRFTMYETNQNNLTKQNEDLRRKLQQIVQLKRSINEYENKLVFATQEVEKLNQTLRLKVEALNASQNQVRNLSMELENLSRFNKQFEVSSKKQIQSLNSEASKKIINFQQNFAQLQRENQDLRRKLNEFTNQHNRTVAEYQNKINFLKEESERLNSIIQSTRTETDQMGRNFMQDIERLKSQNQNMKATIHQYEEMINKLKRQNEQMRRHLQQKDDKIRVMVQEFESFQIQVKTYEGEVNNRYSHTSREMEELKRNLMEAENYINKLKQENEIVSRNSQQEQENLLRNIGQLKNQLVMRSEHTSKVEIQSSKRINLYEQNINVVGKQRDDLKRVLTEYEVQIRNLTRQVEQGQRRYGELQKQYRQIGQQSDNWRKKHQQLEYMVKSKYEVETTKKITTYEQNITEMRRTIHQYQQNNNGFVREIENSKLQIEELRRTIAQYEENKNRAIREIEELKRMISNYERQLNHLRQQYEKNNGQFNQRNQEYMRLQSKYKTDTETLMRQIKEFEVSVNQQMSQKMYSHEINMKGMNQKMNTIVRENEQLKRRINEMGNQIQKLQINLQNKHNELVQSQNGNRKLQSQIEQLHVRLKQNDINSNKRFENQFSRATTMYEQKTSTITREYDSYKTETNRRVVEMQNKIALLSQEIQRLSQTLNAKNQESRQMEMHIRKLNAQIQNLGRGIKDQQQMSMTRLDSEMSRTKTTYQSKITTITRQYEEYRKVNERNMMEWDNQMKQMKGEIQRLNSNLRQKVDENRQLQRNLMRVTQEYERATKTIKEVEYSWSQKFETQVSRTSTTYEQNVISLRSNIGELEKKIHQMNRRMAEDENKIAMMRQEIQRLTQNLKIKTDENQMYQMEIEKLKSNITAYYTVEMEKLTQTVRQRSEEVQILQQKLNQAYSSQEGYQNLQNSYTLITQEYENSKKHLIEYESSIKKLYSEFQRLQMIINQLKEERQILLEKNHGLLQEIERLNMVNNDQEKQIEELRIRLVDGVALEKRVNEQLSLMVVLFAEIETLRQRVKDKEKEVKEVRRSSLAPLRA